MTVLQKMIKAAGTGNTAVIPEKNFDNTLSSFSQLHGTLADICKQLVHDDFDSEACNIAAVTIADSFDCLPQGGLYYALNSTGNDICMILGIESRLAEKVTSQALHVERDEATDYQPSNLDLVLCRSIGACVIDGLSTVFDNVKPDMSEGLSLDAIGYSKSAARAMGPLVCITLTMNVEAKVVAEEAAPKKPKAKGKAGNNVKPQPDAVYEVRILMPIRALDALTAQDVSAVNYDADSPVIDAMDPWYNHMRKNVNDAQVNMRVVVETFNITVADCTRLAIGQIIPLPGVSLNSLALEVDIGSDAVSVRQGSESVFAPTHAKRMEIARAKLGIYKSQRAVRLQEGIDPAFFHNLDVNIQA